jgi:hypothetical protein
MKNVVDFKLFKYLGTSTFIVKNSEVNDRRGEKMSYLFDVPPPCGNLASIE